MNENKRIDNPKTKIRKWVGHEAQYKKALTHYKTTLSLILNTQNCQLLIFTGAQLKAGTGHKMQTVSVVFSKLHF